MPKSNDILYGPVVTLSGTAMQGAVNSIKNTAIFVASDIVSPYIY